MGPAMAEAMNAMLAMMKIENCIFFEVERMGLEVNVAVEILEDAEWLLSSVV